MRYKEAKKRKRQPEIYERWPMASFGKAGGVGAFSNKWSSGEVGEGGKWWSGEVAKWSSQRQVLITLTHWPTMGHLNERSRSDRNYAAPVVQIHISFSRAKSIVWLGFWLRGVHRPQPTPMSHCARFITPLAGDLQLFGIRNAWGFR